jgi:hypothetical protein
MRILLKEMMPGELYQVEEREERKSLPFWGGRIRLQITSLKL